MTESATSTVVQADRMGRPRFDPLAPKVVVASAIGAITCMVYIGATLQAARDNQQTACATISGTYAMTTNAGATLCQTGTNEFRSVRPNPTTFGDTVAKVESWIR